MIKKLFLPVLLLIGQWATVQSQEIRYVLFLGNSYTQVNDLPKMVHDIAKAMGDSINYDSNTPGGYTLMGHSTDATSIAKIQSRDWDYVVLQEQSQLPSFPPSQVATEVFPYAHKLDSIITTHDSCTETVFYMTWGRKNGDASNCGGWPPVCTYVGMQELLRRNYLQMTWDNAATVAPVGMAWYKTRLQSPAFDLWSADESHPSVYGTYLTACVFYSTLFHKSPEGCPYISSISASDAALLQQMAAATVFDSLDLWAGGGDKAYARFTPHINGLNVQFNDSSINATSWLWNFGDGMTSVLEEPTHTYASPGHYIVSLVVNNACFEDTLFYDLDLNVFGLSAPNAQKEIFSLSPNPATHEITVNCFVNSGATSIILMNTIGEEVYRKTGIEKFPVILDISRFPVGLYYLRVTHPGGQSALPFIKAE